MPVFGQASVLGGSESEVFWHSDYRGKSRPNIRSFQYGRPAFLVEGEMTFADIDIVFRALF